MYPFGRNFWKELSQSGNCFPGILHLHLEVACLASHLEVEAKLRAGSLGDFLCSFQTEIRECQTDRRFVLRGKGHFPLPSPQRQSMPGSSRNPLLYHKEDSQTDENGTHAHS